MISRASAGRVKFMSRQIEQSQGEQRQASRFQGRETPKQMHGKEASKVRQVNG
jgi:hypothetical protein